MPDLKITRRHLPHWQLEGSTYFVTFRCKRTSLTEQEQRIVLHHIKEGDDKFYDLFAVIVMPDHVHLLVRPLKRYDLSRVMKGLKGVSAHRLNLNRGRKGIVWQNESYDRIVRDGDEFDRELNYMFENPVKKGLTEDALAYVGWYLNFKKCGFDVPSIDDLPHSDEQETA
jgi:REP element-mobilizing transposase RayT